MARRDPDYTEVDNYDLNELKFQNQFGICASFTQGDLWEKFKDIPDGTEFPVQCPAGPMLGLQTVTPCMPSVKKLLIHKKIKLFLHMPFMATLYGGVDLSFYFLQLHAQWKEFEVGYVLHCGSAKVETNFVGVAQKKLLNYVDLLQDGKDYILLENLASQVKENSFGKYNSIIFLYKYFSGIPALSGKVKLCWDTEHAWTSKCKMPTNKSIWNQIKLIHCNGCPICVCFGGFRDLHSFTSLEKSISYEGVFTLDNLEHNPPLYSLPLIISKGVPMIMERHILDIMIKDISFCLKVKQGVNL